MSIDTNVSVRTPLIAETTDSFLVPATGALVLAAIAIATVIMVQLGVLPWTLSEVDPGTVVGSLPIL